MDLEARTMKAVTRTPPPFADACSELERSLSMPAPSGISLRDASHIGSTALLALRLLRGDVSIESARIVLTQPNDDNTPEDRPATR